MVVEDEDELIELDEEDEEVLVTDCFTDLDVPFATIGPALDCGAGGSGGILNISKFKVSGRPSGPFICKF